MWGRKRRELIERLASLEQAVKALIDAPRPSHPDATAILADAFTKSAGNQADLVKQIGDIAISSAARQMGIRGGRRRAQNAERTPRGRFLPRREATQPRCPLCIDPNYSHVTISMIQEHRRHEAARQNALFNGGNEDAVDASAHALDEPGSNGNAPARPADG